MALADYVRCDVCDCKVIYDGYWEMRDRWEENGNEPTIICHECATRAGPKLAEALKAARVSLSALKEG